MADERPSGQGKASPEHGLDIDIVAMGRALVACEAVKAPLLRTRPLPTTPEGWDALATELAERLDDSRRFIAALEKAGKVSPDFWWRQVTASLPRESAVASRPSDDEVVREWVREHRTPDDMQAMAQAHIILGQFRAAEQRLMDTKEEK